MEEGEDEKAEEKDSNISGGQMTFWQKLDTNHVIDHNSTFSQRWDIVTAILLVFVTIWTPFELGFLRTDVSTDPGLALFILSSTGSSTSAFSPTFSST